MTIKTKYKIGDIVFRLREVNNVFAVCSGTIVSVHPGSINRQNSDQHQYSLQEGTRHQESNLYASKRALLRSF